MLVAITPNIARQCSLVAREVHGRRRNELNIFSWNFAARMQIMDLPIDIWANVKDCMSPPEWAKAYGINRTTHALRPWVAVEMHMLGGVQNGEHDLVDQLQLDNWPTRHSLFLNLEQLQEAVQLTPAQTQDIRSAGNKLPRLHCLHLIGRDGMPLTRSSIEGVIVSALTEHVSVLSLQVGMIEMPLAAPNLQHLVVALKFNETWVDQLFPAVRLLKRLRTLYVQSCSNSSRTSIGRHIDLTECAHLQHVAMQGVSFTGPLYLPVECQLHAILKEFEFLSDAFTNGGVNVYTGVTMLYEVSDAWRMWADIYPAPLSNLGRLRLILCNDFYGQDYGGGELLIDSDILPHLRVLELTVQNDLSLCIKTFYLTSVVILAAGSLNLDVEDLPSYNTYKLCVYNRCTLEEIYIRSSDDFWYDYYEIRQARIEDPLAYWGNLPAGEYPEYFVDEQRRYIIQKPVDFEPGSLEDCCCNACLECLARAGVPILCEQAWTSDGFQKHLRPSCNEEP